MAETRIRITSDGTPRGTRVETEDGTLVKGLQVIDWHCEMNQLAKVELVALGVPVDVVGLVENDGSMVEDPEAIPELAVPQTPPEGPGFDFPAVREES